MSVRHRSSIFRFLALSVLALTLSGCAETNLMSHYGKKLDWPGQETGSSTYKVGNPYRVGSVWYYPRESFDTVETGIASWYGPDFHGKKTANGELYDQNELTAAHRTLQMPSLVRVTNLENGRSIVVRINDRGPFKHGRVIDLSKRGAELLGYINKGTARVKLEVLDKESRQIAAAAQRGVDTSRLTMADLDSMKGGAWGSAEGTSVGSTRVAALDSDINPNVAPAMPESLQTPTITVEELAAPAGSRSSTSTLTEHEREWRDVEPTKVSTQVPTGHVAGGRFMPDAVVTQEPVVKTGLFIQAASFSVRRNADNLQQSLSAIGPSFVETAMVNGRTVYRVKLGPIASVDAADRMLDKVIRSGSGSARVIKH